VSKAIVWFRQDLRLADNPAWAKAVGQGLQIIPLFIVDESASKDWAMGDASRWWLHHALLDLDAQLREVGSRLLIRVGASEEILRELMEEAEVTHLYWNRCYEPYRVRLDGGLKDTFKRAGLTVWSGNASLVREPWEVATQAGQPYKVYTPYSRACAKLAEPEPVAVPGSPLSPEQWPTGCSVESLQLLPRIGWDSGFKARWEPTRRAGISRLKHFLAESASAYGEARDYPAVAGTSGLSPYLHFGQIGPREVLAAIREVAPSSGVSVYHREIIWREFAYHVLYHFPSTPEQPLQLKYANFPWREDPQALRAWQQGRTGYPIVDAGMRELWQTGWMHNRVRMVVASFLVKHLLLSWQSGAAWFWDTLVDADLASNTLGWQWAGGCGADAAPYFRVFNPITQAEKFDPEGTYIRRFVPELRSVKGRYIFTPWEMPDSLQTAFGCRIGRDYPAPIVEHKAGRERALAALASLKEGSS
jgi:deoxyribodipyrimidine photo-lyase